MNEMSEQVVAGGLKSFNYNKNVELKLDDERKKDIKEGYEKYYKKREREERTRKRNWILLIILVLLGIWVFLR